MFKNKKHQFLLINLTNGLETFQVKIPIKKIKRQWKEFTSEFNLTEEFANGKKVEFIFDKAGNFIGHLWNHNCFYTFKDLQRNKAYKFADIESGIAYMEELQ